MCSVGAVGSLDRDATARGAWRVTASGVAARIALSILYLSARPPSPENSARKTPTRPPRRVVDSDLAGTLAQCYSRSGLLDLGDHCF